MTYNILKKFVCIVAFFVLTVHFAQIVNANDECETVAKNFLNYLHSAKEIKSKEIVYSSEFDNQGVPALCLVHLKGGGYIAVSASESASPVKAYSLYDDFDGLPYGFKRFLILEMEYVKRTEKIRKPFTRDLKQHWDFLLEGNNTREVLSYTSDTFLVKTRWDQGYPYNKFLPLKDGKNTLAGCVNVAVAQIMKYWGHPVRGRGVTSYKWENKDLKAILSRNYNWENMPDVLDGKTPEHLIDEIALLIKDIAIVNKTAFGIESSLAQLNPELVNYFNYSEDISDMDNSNGEIFFTTLRNEIDNMRPVLISFPGHMTIADGYASDPTGRKIHINMGWGGRNNDYYYLDQPVITGSYTFQPILKMYFNIKPATNFISTDLENDDIYTAKGVKGIFNSRWDMDTYQVYLNGETTIKGKRGYGNLAFFIRIYDAKGALIFETNGYEPAWSSISVGNLKKDKYLMKISLCNSQMSCMSYGESDFFRYEVEISTENISIEEKALIDETSDNPPVFLNDNSLIFLNSSKASKKFLLDVRDEDGDEISLSFINLNNGAVDVSLTGNILDLKPKTGITNVAAKIKIFAKSKNKTTEKDLIVIVTDSDFYWGSRFEITDYFEGRYDSNIHKVFLEGPCTVSGSRGYTNQAFFISILDSNRNIIIQPLDQEIINTFPRGIYFIEASPSNGSASYNVTAGVDDSYYIFISCTSFSADYKDISISLGVDIQNLDRITMISLEKGWNFVSFPTFPPDTSINGLFGNISQNIRIIWGYDNQDKQWLNWRPSVNCPQSSFICSIEGGKGYWIYINAATTIDMLSWTPGSRTINLSKGWNLIGWNGPHGIPISDALSKLGSTWDIIWGWENGIWKAKLPDGSTLPYAEPLTTLHQGRAYWIKMKGATEWVQ